MEEDQILETMRKINTLISYFSEVQIKILSTKQVARAFDNHALAAATTKAGNGIIEMINILQGAFEAVEKESGTTQIPVTGATHQFTFKSKKKPHSNLTLFRGGQYDKED